MPSNDRGHRRPWPLRGFAIALALALLTFAGWGLGPASAEDAPPPPLAPALERLFPQLQETRETLPPFLRDSDLPRNADEFVSMSEQAGATGTNDGVGLAGVRLTPLKGLQIDFSEQHGVNTFNTIYAAADYLYPLNEDWKVRFAAQITDQRAVGAALVANAASRYWATQAGGARVQLIYQDLTLTGGFSITGSGNTIQSPWGSYPGYLSLIDPGLRLRQ